MSGSKITLKSLLDAVNNCIQHGCPPETEIVRMDPMYNEIYLPGMFIPERSLESISIQLPMDGQLSHIQIEKEISFIE